jgi:hypothetical protein
MDEKIIERLDRIEKKLDAILERLPYYYTATYPYPQTDTHVWDGNEVIVYGDEPDS